MKSALLAVMSAAAVFAAWRVFRTSSMVRAAYWLMASFLGVAVIMVALDAEFLGLVLVLMMAGEMTIMALMMVMFMMNPAGLNPMMMVHQHHTAIATGVVSFLGLAGVGVFGHFPIAPVIASTAVTAALGHELLGDSMLIFETAGVALLATMIGALAIASSRGRFGDSDTGSHEPLRPNGAGPASAVVPASTDVTSTEGHPMANGSQDEMVM